MTKNQPMEAKNTENDSQNENKLNWKIYPNEKNNELKEIVIGKVTIRVQAKNQNTSNQDQS